MSINRLVDDLECTLGLSDEHEDFMSDMNRELVELFHLERQIAELPTLEKELEKQKALLEQVTKTADSEKSALAKRIAEIEAKNAVITKQSQDQTAKMEKEMRKLDEERIRMQKQLDQEKRLAAQKIEELTKTIEVQEFVSKSQLVELQKKTRASLEKCYSMQSMIKRHATIYGKQNDQYKKLQSIYKQEKEALAACIRAVGDATNTYSKQQAAKRAAFVTMIPRHKIESVF